MKTNECVSWILGCVSRKVSSPFPHLLKDDDVVSCCLDLSIPCISFRVNGLPVQGMFENFNANGLLYPVVSFSAGVKLVSTLLLFFWVGFFFLCFFLQEIHKTINFLFLFSWKTKQEFVFCLGEGMESFASCHLQVMLLALKLFSQKSDWRYSCVRNTFWIMVKGNKSLLAP